MHSGQWIAVAAVVVAVVALLCVGLLARQLRRTNAELRRLARSALGTDDHVASFVDDRSTPAGGYDDDPHRVVVTTEGRAVVVPTAAQVADAILHRPLVRGAVLSHGLAHALRPESRDRIAALVRREYRSRRKARLRAGRTATRVHPRTDEVSP